jgi:hypothetical protein
MRTTGGKPGHEQLGLLHDVVDSTPHLLPEVPQWVGRPKEARAEARQPSARWMAAATRDRVTVDLRGLGPRLEAQAARRQISRAALIRRAVIQMLDDEPSDGGASAGAEGSGIDHVVKVTLRLSSAQAALLALRARVSDVAQGAYVGALLEGTPPVPRPANHGTAVAALRSSTDRLAAMSADLNAFLRLVGHAPKERLEPYRAGLLALTTDVRDHMATAARLIAELRPMRRPK